MTYSRMACAPLFSALLLVGGCFLSTGDDDDNKCVTDCDSAHGSCSADCDKSDNSCHLACDTHRDECTKECK